MKRATKIEKEWITKCGDFARVVFIEFETLPINCESESDSEISMCNFGHRCGYVHFDKGHWIHDVGYDELNYEINAHGGLTYSGSGTNGWAIGFDCAHSDDKTPFNQSGIERTLDYCIEQCENISFQAQELNDKSFAYFIIAKKTKSKLSEDKHNKMIALNLVGDLYAKNYFELLKNNFQDESK